MGPKRRERFNAKARQSRAGGSSHKGRKNVRLRSTIEADANAPIMDDETRAALAEQDRQRRELLREGGHDETMKISSKKRRRLDKFIENKLRKEEKVRILEKLAKSSADIGDRTELVSAATLGTGRVSKESERVQKILQEQASGSKRKRAQVFQVKEDDDDQDLDVASESDDGPLEREHVRADDDERQKRIMEAVKKFEPSSGVGSALASAPPPAAPGPVGSALKKGADGQPATLIMRKRDRQGRVQGRSNLSIKERVIRGKNEVPRASQETDSSFDSSEDEESDSHVYDVDKMLERKRQNAYDDESVPTDELESEEADTDADEEAVLLEAMKRRGLIPLDAKSIPDTFGQAEEEDEDEDEEEEDEEEEDEEEEDEEDEEEEEGEDEDDEDEEEEDEEDEEEEEGEDEDDEDEDDDSDDGPMLFDDMDKPKSKRRGIGESERSRRFKDYALNALKLARPSEATDERPLEPVGGRVDRVRDLGPQDGKIRGPLGQEAPTKRSPFTERYYQDESVFSTMKEAPIRHVSVTRPQDLQDARMQLPVVAEEDSILRTIQENPVTVICGETGSGKTTQVPQFLYEAAFGSAGSANPGMIGITQPRRVAAVSMARRVGEELGLDHHRVSHQIRYDATTSPQTQIKFMTDGVLLRELAQDLTLTKYSVIVVDEAHERSVNTDVLIGMLSRVVRLRADRWIHGAPGTAAPRPLRLVIMSATMRVGDFTQNTTLFSTPPPVIHIGARQHPVTIHFNRRTVQDYVTEAVKKASKIHTRLPAGGILVFLTGQQEVHTVCRKLQQKYGPAATRKVSIPERHPVSTRVADTEAEEVDLGTDESPVVDEPVLEDNLDEEALDSDDEMEELADSDMPMHILPLYSLLPAQAQQAVFEEPPPNSRLVVVATNVAETSITIPHIKYVVDCGRSKERHIHPQSQVQSFHVSWISKASAAQRAGRAGRTGPGHCYRLYSSAVFEEHFVEYGVPEILRMPVDGLVLQMKAMNIENVAHFPFPTPPERSALQQAERLLVHLGALERTNAQVGEKRQLHASVTSLGRVMALFPVVPRYAKLLAQGHQHACLAHAIAIVAAMSVGDVFEREESLHVPETDDPAAAKEARRAVRSRYWKKLHAFDALGEGLSDAFRILSVVGAYTYEAGRGNSLAFCHDNFVRVKAMEEINKLRAQLSGLVVSNLAGLSEAEMAALQQPQLTPPNPTQCKVLRQLLCAISIDRVAVRADVVGAPEATNVRHGSQGNARGVPYVALGVPGTVYLHRSSALYQRAPPEWVVFGEVSRSTPKQATVDTDEPPPTTAWLKMVTRINPAWLPTLGRSLCTFSQPSETATAQTLATSMQSLKHGKRTEMQRDILLTPRYGGSMQDGAAAGGLGWELPPIKVKQVLVHGRWTTQM